MVDNSATDFPTEQAVKTYVDTQVAAAADDDITGASLDAPTNVLTISEGATDVTVNLSDLDDTAAIAAVQADVDGNEEWSQTFGDIEDDRGRDVIPFGTGYAIVGSFETPGGNPPITSDLYL